jgi:bifunctional aspartokinase / homoserine dehydrogenase 1
MQVLKFGGSSVANADVIKQVIAIVEKALIKDKTIVVVSALGGVTDQLIMCGTLAAAGDESFNELLKKLEQRHLEAVQQLVPVTQQSSVLSMVKQRCNELEDICRGVYMLKELSPRTQDRIVSFGEWLSSQIIAAAFNTNGTPCEWVNSSELIKTNDNYTNATVNFDKTNKNIQQYFDGKNANLYLAPGFISSSESGTLTTLGRGGSDYTASIFAGALHVANLEIWTDVSGMMTADPRHVPNAKSIPQISYREAMELSHFGAKVVYPPTIQPVMGMDIPVWVKNTFAPSDMGTVIKDDANYKSKNSITGISSIGKIALLSLEGGGMVGIPGFSKRLFEGLSREKINVILITQSSSEHSICVAIEETNSEKAKTIIDEVFAFEISMGKVDPLVVEKGQAIVALVGDSMKSHTGISGKMFGALGRNGINVRAIAQGSSERNISAVISADDVKKALNVLHEQFFETSYKQLNLFIIGVGNVGSKLLQQLQQQHQYLLNNLMLQVRVVGMGNSKKMLFNDEGIDLANWQNLLAEGQQMDIEKFIETIQIKNLRNSVFADVTANASIASNYLQLLEKSIAVVACNKIACSSPYPYYKQLKDAAREYNTQFLFETNVGAGLPVIGSLNDLIKSGDKVSKIEAVLSGTLNFVFNNYNSEKSFASVVKDAQDEGFTEPDPRLDLSGTDVMRKIMILAREAGEAIEMDDIENASFMPESCMTGDVANFYTEMEKHEDHFKKLYAAAAYAGKKLKFVATFSPNSTGGKQAAVGLQHIDPQSDFYHLYGKDNVVLFYTNRYPEQPLVVKGAGAGADVTASGVFADIIRTVR